MVHQGNERWEPSGSGVQEETARRKAMAMVHGGGEVRSNIQEEVVGAMRRRWWCTKEEKRRGMWP